MKRRITQTARCLFALSIIILSICKTSMGQDGVRIATTTGTADPSAMLDVISTSKGVLIPRMTSGQRTAIGAPATGLLVYQTDAPSGYWYYNGSLWVQMGIGALSGSGSSNYLPKWTASASLGNSQVYDNGNVGIGTTAPGA